MQIHVGSESATQKEQVPTMYLTFIMTQMAVAALVHGAMGTMQSELKPNASNATPGHHFIGSGDEHGSGGRVCCPLGALIRDGARQLVHFLISTDRFR